MWIYVNVLGDYMRELGIYVYNWQAQAFLEFVERVTIHRRDNPSDRAGAWRILKEMAAERGYKRPVILDQCMKRATAPLYRSDLVQNIGLDKETNCALAWALADFLLFYAEQNRW